MNQLEDKFLPALKRLNTDKQLVRVEMLKRSAFAVVCSIQLASRHPNAASSGTLKMAINVARQIGESIGANDPDLRQLIAMGWEKTFDEKTP